MISLLSELLFHWQTEVSHCKNIARFWLPSVLVFGWGECQQTDQRKAFDEGISVGMYETFWHHQLDGTKETKNEQCHSIAVAPSGRCPHRMFGPQSSSSLSFLGDKTILLKAGSKVFVHRDKDGRGWAVVVVSIDGHLSSLLDILLVMGESRYDLHLMNSNCKMKL